MKKRDVKVLTVDDDEFMQQVIHRLLIQLGYVMIKEVGSGDEALRLVDTLKVPPDVIILDLRLPGMDGIEFVRHLVSRAFTGQLILLSGEDERLLRSAQNLVHAHNIPVLGYLMKPVGETDLEALMDKLLRQTPSPEHPGRATVSTEELQVALDEHQLTNDYQPVVTMADGELASLEVLVRWQHPQRGELSPALFIPLAEEQGLVHELTRQVAGKALRQLRDWRDQGWHFSLSINLSMENLDDLDFTDWLTREVIDSGAQPWDLVLEITESRPMRRPHIVLDNLTRLRLKGFKLAIDDFGTGHASLAKVRDIPFDQFKLDRSFVHGADRDHRIRVMFESALGLARELDLEVTAEGVEDKDDWLFLRQQSCQKAQGYFIARPMPASAVPEWFSHWRRERVDTLFPHLAATAIGNGSTKQRASSAERGVALIVEDNEFQRKVQARILREEGFEPEMAADGREALERLRMLRPALILIDIEMPGLNGLDLLRRLRATRTFARTPVLVISGVNTKTVVQDSMTAGANSFMVKPYNRQTLVERIARAMDP